MDTRAWQYKDGGGQTRHTIQLNQIKKHTGQKRHWYIMQWFNLKITIGIYLQQLNQHFSTFISKKLFMKTK